MRKSWPQSSFTESPTTERNAEYIAAESTVGSSIQRGSIGPSMECRVPARGDTALADMTALRLMVKLAEPGFDSATKLEMIEARRLQSWQGCTTAGTRKLKSYPWGFMGTPWGPMGWGEGQ